MKVKDGKFGRYLLLADEDRRMEFEIQGSEPIKVNGDRRSHYAVFTKCHVFGTEGYELFILSRAGGVLVQTASYATGLAGFDKVKYIRQSEGLIIVGMSYRQFGTTVPRDDERYEFKYRFSGGELKLVDHGRSH